MAYGGFVSDSQLLWPKNGVFLCIPAVAARLRRMERLCPALPCSALPCLALLCPALLCSAQLCLASHCFVLPIKHCFCPAAAGYTGGDPALWLQARPSRGGQECLPGGLSPAAHAQPAADPPGPACRQRPHHSGWPSLAGGRLWGSLLDTPPRNTWLSNSSHVSQLPASTADVSKHIVCHGASTDSQTKDEVTSCSRMPIATARWLHSSFFAGAPTTCMASARLLVRYPPTCPPTPPFTCSLARSLTHSLTHSPIHHAGVAGASRALSWLRHVSPMGATAQPLDRMCGRLACCFWVS